MMEQTPVQRHSFMDWARLCMAYFERLFRSDPTELAEALIGFHAVWWGAGVLLLSSPFNGRNLLYGREDVVGIGFVLLGVAKYGTIVLDRALALDGGRGHYRAIAGGLLLIAWVVVTTSFWLVNPGGTGFVNYSSIAVIQTFLFIRQVARRAQ